MKCFISGKETKNKTKNVPVHRDHREEFKKFVKENGHPYNNLVEMRNLMKKLGNNPQNAGVQAQAAPSVRSNAHENHS